MRINEILIESQLNEEVLTELDWSKIKKGLATGAITLSALGISGNAMAQHFKVDNASKIKDSQVVKYVQDKVDTGEIKPAVVKQAVQKVDAAPEIKKDEPKKAAPDTAPEVKSKAAEPKQDVKPEVKKDEPKKELSKDGNTSNIVEKAKMAPYKVARLIKRTAFDGDSLKFDDWRMKSVSDKSGDGWLIITGSVNGKNKFGAYVGFKQFLATIDPDTGEVQKLYMENDPKYIQALALISTFKTNLSTPVIGPSAGKWGLF
jgi:hypothetical protein